MENRDKLKIAGIAVLLLVGLVLIIVNVMPSKPKIAEQGAPPPSAGPRRGMVNPDAQPAAPGSPAEAQPK